MNLSQQEAGVLRKKAQRFLVTVDQIGVGDNKLEKFDLKEIEMVIKSKYAKNISYCCISRERHLNKGWHVHIWIQFIKRVDYTKNSFNFVCKKQANVQVVGRALKDRVKSLTYVRKSQDFIEFGKRDIDLSDQSVSNVPSYVIKAIEEGISLEKLLGHEIEQIRQYALRHVKQIKTMIYEIENLQHIKKIQSLKGIEKIQTTKFRKEYREIAKILNQAENMREHKTLNLHLWSREPGMGKTSLVRKLMSCSPCYIFPPDGWFTRYTNYVYQFIIWDEMDFRGFRPTFLNLFLEGARCQMPVKGDLTHKWDNPLVVMLSNKPIKEHLENITNERDREIYTKTLGVRVKEIQLTKPLFKFVDFICSKN